MQQRSAETREQILTAAMTLFAKSGYTAAGVAEICSAAQISKGAFYHHFPSKQAVFLAILEAELLTLDQSFSAANQQAQPTDQTLLAMAEQAGSTLQSADVRLSILLEFWFQAAREPDIWAAAIAPYQRYTTYLAEIIRQGVREGSLREVNPEQAARTLVALAMGLLLQAMFESNNLNWAQETHQAVELLLSGLRKEENESDHRSDRTHWKRTGSTTDSKWSGGKGTGFTR